MLRKIILFFLCSLLMMSCSGGDLKLHDATGHSLSAAKLKDKWIIVNYWAAWCDACAREMPEFNEFYARNTNKNILMYGVNYDQLQASNLDNAIKALNVKFPVLTDDPAKVWQLSSVNVLPTTFVINPKGVVVKQIIGPTTAESLTNVIQQLQSGSA